MRILVRTFQKKARKICGKLLKKRRQAWLHKLTLSELGECLHSFTYKMRCTVNRTSSSRHKYKLIQLSEVTLHLIKQMGIRGTLFNDKNMMNSFKYFRSKKTERKRYVFPSLIKLPLLFFSAARIYRVSFYFNVLNCQ